MCGIDDGGRPSEEVGVAVLQEKGLHVLHAIDVVGRAIRRSKGDAKDDVRAGPPRGRRVRH